MHALNAFKELLVRISCGKEFHNFDAEWEKERSYSAERDLGMHKSPFSDDLKRSKYTNIIQCTCKYVCKLLRLSASRFGGLKILTNV